jgi:serine/threonine protein kinase/cyclophilin family peptidyl-prolyl cis-trans isomerase
MESTQALPPGTRIEEFVIERVLGSGGFGITYLARDASLSRQVVIKENLPAQFSWRDPASGTVRPRATSGGEADDFLWSMQNFLREADTLASLDHPGIVRVLRKFEANGTAYFVMPFVDGVALDELIEERQREHEWFTEIELTGMLSRLLAALDYLHARGIYHRDIKPGNILITSEGIPMLIDFGSARQRLSERSMTVVESAGYTPFEQLQTRGEIGPWSDLYALGATLVKAITGTAPPKAADRVMGDPWQGVSRDAQWMKVYSTSFLQSIDQVLSVNPAQRWQSGDEWMQAVNANPSTPHPADAPVIAATNLSPLQPPLTGMDDSPNIPPDQSETTNEPVTFRPKSARKVSKGTRQTLIAGACGLMVISVALLAIQKSGENHKPAQTEIPKAVVTTMLPPELIEGTPKPIDVPNLVQAPTAAPEFLVPQGTVLLSKGKPVTSSDDAPIICELSVITDGEKDAGEGYFVELLDGLQWVQIDLEKSSTISAIWLWHFHSQKRAYHDVIIQVSDDAAFKTGVTTIYNNDYDDSAKMGKGSDSPYVETRFGMLADGKGSKGRYVRLYSNGSTSNEMNHYIEVEVFGIPLPSAVSGIPRATSLRPRILLETSEGDIILELDKDKAPVSVENFLGYVKKNHYDGTVFHRVMNGFMIQGGGFALTDGKLIEKSAGMGIKNEGQNGLKNLRGSIAMARTNDPNSAKTQFFINVVDNSALDYPSNGGYAVFGKVIKGMEVVDKIKAMPTGNLNLTMRHPATGAPIEMPSENVPVENVVIVRVSIIE